jgi:hypothetical protein
MRYEAGVPANVAECFRFHNTEKGRALAAGRAITQRIEKKEHLRVRIHPTAQGGTNAHVDVVSDLRRTICCYTLRHVQRTMVNGRLLFGGAFDRSSEPARQRQICSLVDGQTNT